MIIWWTNNVRLRSIFFFGDDVVELFEGEILVGLGLIEDMCIMHHLDNLLVVHGLT